MATECLQRVLVIAGFAFLNQQGSGEVIGFQSPRSILLSKLGTVEISSDLPCYTSAQWRYPPVQTL